MKREREREMDFVNAGLRLGGGGWRGQFERVSFLLSLKKPEACVCVFV
jgi:hypothetical protein